MEGIFSMPTPNPGEKQSEFIPRCMQAYDDEGKDLSNEKVRKQCLAICYSKFERANEEFIKKIDFVTEAGMVSGNITGNGDPVMSTVVAKGKKDKKKPIKRTEDNDEIGVNEKESMSSIWKSAHDQYMHRTGKLTNDFENKFLESLKEKLSSLNLENKLSVKVKSKWQDIGQDRYIKELQAESNDFFVSFVICKYLSRTGKKMGNTEYQLYQFNVRNDNQKDIQSIINALVSTIKRYNGKKLSIRDVDDYVKPSFHNISNKITLSGRI